MKKSQLLILCCGLLLACSGGFAQRSYRPSSVLAGGSWFRISVGAPGVYKMDIPFLNNLGLNTAGLASSSVRLYGNGGGMLSESNSGPWTDDLYENAILVVDGGDGTLNGSDYILFYAPGPDEWLKDSVSQAFFHRKNIYSDKSFYFLTVGGTGKRISPATGMTSPVATVNSFTDRYFHELDTVNFLSSGKEWYGEEMSNLPGRSLSRDFLLPISGLQTGTSLRLRAQCVARSINSGSRIEIRLNGQQIGQMSINPTGSGPYDLFGQQATVFLQGTAQAVNTVRFTYVPGSMNAQGWLNWFEVFGRSNISLAGRSQLFFRDWASVGTARAEFVVGQADNNTQVWDITSPRDPQKMTGQLVNNEFRFVNEALRLREYVAFGNTSFPVPVAEGLVSNQDLHAAAPADYLIISHASLLDQAREIAEIHRRQNNFRVAVVSTAQIFNEFSSGSPDPAAIRDFVKMYWDKYGLTAERPKYLLLFGDASFDYKDRLVNNSNLVPAWQNDFSLDPLSTYTSDDFFGFLDDTEDIGSGTVTNLLDVGIGRIPARNREEASNFVEKLKSYYGSGSLGPWRNNLTFLADDEDGNLHLQDAELISGTAQSQAPVLNQQKIYLDAYRQESGPGGSQYPGASLASQNQLINGTLIWNYSGHGGPRRLAEETILDQQIIDNINNVNKLPLFITATCDFAPFDNPISNSLGENILLRPKTGAIALMTTTRLVFAFSNRIMNNNYIRFALEQDPAGRYRTLGEATRVAKNFTYQNLSDIANIRKFTLLGDPALTLGFPSFQVRVTRINGLPASQADTLSSAEKVTIEGEVTDQGGNLLSDFNGYAYPTVFDKPGTVTTLANDPGSQPASFQVQNTVLYKGKTSVSNGRFRFEFRVPRDINYRYGNGKLSLYAEDGARDANGAFNNFLVGGSGADSSGDKEGPRIRLFLNDEFFANGGITNQRPLLIVKMADSSGINTTGTGIGHDIVATLDQDNRQYFILNDYYQGELNSYQQGTARFQLPELEPGPHVLHVKAWDVLNNPGDAQLEFTVAKNEELGISHVLNYPNPFTRRTNFWFEHNKPGQPLRVQVQIMTISGRVVRSISQTIVTEGNRSAELEWDGRDDFGDNLGRGVYLYRLRVTDPEGNRKEIYEKLVKLD